VESRPIISLHVIGVEMVIMFMVLGYLKSLWYLLMMLCDSI
jgi:hypothetical protein